MTLYSVLYAALHLAVGKAAIRPFEVPEQGDALHHRRARQTSSRKVLHLVSFLSDTVGRVSRFHCPESNDFHRHRIPDFRTARLFRSSTWIGMCSPLARPESLLSFHPAGDFLPGATCSGCPPLLGICPFVALKRPEVNGCLREFPYGSIKKAPCVTNAGKYTWAVWS